MVDPTPLRHPLGLPRRALAAAVLAGLALSGCGVNSTRRMWAYQPAPASSIGGYVRVAGVRTGQALATPATVIVDGATDQRTYEVAAVVVVVAAVVVVVAVLSDGKGCGNLNFGSFNFSGSSSSSSSEDGDDHRDQDPQDEERRRREREQAEATAP